MAYVLGHSEGELRRLAFQAQLIEPITRQLLIEAGVGPGMRVLDLGTGRGDVALLAAELVGETGSVVGVDRSPTALAPARERAAALPAGNVSFAEGDAAELTFDAPFDAVVGRYVLEFVPDPAAKLRRLLAHLRPGGVVAFHEIDWTGCRSYPPVPLWDRCCRLAEEALRAGGADTQVGIKLPSILVAAGLREPSMRTTTVVGVGETTRGLVQRLAGLFLTLLPSMEELGLAAPSEFDPETFEQRVFDAVAAAGGAVVAGSENAAWARL